MVDDSSLATLCVDSSSIPVCRDSILHLPVILSQDLPQYSLPFHCTQFITFVRRCRLLPTYSP